MTPVRPRRRLLAQLLSLLALVASMMVGLGSASASAAIVSPGADPAHPFSNPVWWPLSNQMRMDCYFGNPNCSTPHTNWLMDVVSSNVSVLATTANEPIFAMGAGIVHYGVTSDQGCGGVHGRGNWLYIDHGNGVLSWYGHMYWPFKVANGQYVTPRTRIGSVGNSGYGNCKIYPRLHYIDIAVKHGGTNGQYVQFTHSYACVHGVKQVWPQQMSTNPNGAWHTWNQVPATGHDPTASLIPASDANRSCVPATPATADRSPTGRLAGAGSGILRASWTPPASRFRVRYTYAILQEYHPSIRLWLDLRTHRLSPATSATSFTALQSRRLYRARVMFFSYVGYSAPSAWHSATAP